MATFAGIFFSSISLLGLFRSKSLTTLRKMVLLAFSIFLIITQLLFLNSVLEMGSQEFIFLSGILSGIILILAFQRSER